jgi:hypothetical protein
MMSKFPSTRIAATCRKKIGERSHGTLKKKAYIVAFTASLYVV